jgi:hypothetical protein
MPLWDFKRESNYGIGGANTESFLKRGQPVTSSDQGAAVSKRTVIATDRGWVNRLNYTDVHGTARSKEKVLVAAHPGISGKSYTSNTYTGQPDIVQLYVKLNANGYITANSSTANLYVVFNAPVNFRASGNNLSIVVANTASGNNADANFANTLGQGRIVNANNTLVFRLPPLMANTTSATAPIATYKINAQTISVTGNPLYNPEKSIVYSANLVIAAPVSNNLIDGVGSTITTFQVAPVNQQ